MDNISAGNFYIKNMADIKSHILWEAVLKGDQAHSRRIIQSDIDQLKKLSNECNCWIYYNPETKVTALPLDEWNEIYDQDRNRWIEELKAKGRHISVINHREPFKARHPRISFFLRRILRLHLPFISPIIQHILNRR